MARYRRPSRGTARPSRTLVAIAMTVYGLYQGHATQPLLDTLWFSGLAALLVLGLVQFRPGLYETRIGSEG